MTGRIGYGIVDLAIALNLNYIEGNSGCGFKFGPTGPPTAAMCTAFIPLIDK